MNNYMLFILKYFSYVARLATVAGVLLSAPLLTNVALADVKGPIEVSSPDLGTWEAIGWSFEAEVPITVSGSGGGTTAERFLPKEVIIERYTDENTVLIIQAMINVSLGSLNLADVSISRGDLVVTLGMPAISDYSMDTNALIAGKNRYSRSRAPQVETLMLKYHTITYSVGEQSVCFDIVQNQYCD